MNGLTKKYKESLQRTPGPIMPSELPKVTLDMQGMIRYAEKKGVAPNDLSGKEKSKFIRKK